MGRAFGGIQRQLAETVVGGPVLGLVQQGAANSQPLVRRFDGKLMRGSDPGAGEIGAGIFGVSGCTTIVPTILSARVATKQVPP